MGTILSTRDGGKNWEEQSSGTTHHLFGLTFVDESFGWAVGDFGTIIHTPDGGKTWLSQGSGEDRIYNDVHFIDRQNGWVAGEYGKAMQTAEELLALANRCGAKLQVGHAHLGLGMATLETNLAQAAPHLEQSIAIYREIKAQNMLAIALAFYGGFHKKQGRITEARNFLTKALEIFERLGHLIWPDEVRKELAEFPSEG